jgi:hypothetical protein
LKDELKKLGLRIRPRVVAPRPQKPGRIAFDERGNAIYEWDDARLAADGEDGERARRTALEHPDLSIVEDEPANAPMRSNPKGLRIGYNPYESGLLAKKKEAGRKRDLRQLSKWMEVKRKAKPDGDEDL